MKYFDAHCHVQFPVYDEDREAVLARMQETEVGGLIVGTERASSEAAVLRADGKTLFAAIGLHPNHAHEEEFDTVFMSELAKDSRVVAIGECGLDFFRPEDAETAKVKQKEVFEAHIRLAKETGKLLMVHARPSKGTDDAYEEVLNMLTAHPSVRANFHFFVGTASMAERIVDAGHTCSFTAVLTFTSDYDEVIRTLPLTHILSETDAPYVAPAPNRGKRNDPTAVTQVVKAIARIRGEREEEVARALLKNACRVFGLPSA